MRRMLILAAALCTLGALPEPAIIITRSELVSQLAVERSLESIFFHAGERVASAYFRGRQAPREEWLSFLHTSVEHDK